MENVLSKFGDYLSSERRYSPHTVKAYVTDLAEFQAHYKARTGGDNLLDVAQDSVRSWIMELRSSGISVVSINRKISTLRSFYKWLLKTGKIEKSPAFSIRNLKKPRHLPEFVPQEQMVEILENDDLYADDKDGERNRLIIELFYDTGIRETELINIKCQDVDPHSLTVRVHGKGGKTRLVPITKTLCDRLMAQATSPDNYLFLTGRGAQMYPRLVYRIVHKYLEDAQGVSRKSPHTLRHSFATSMLNNDAPLNAIKEILGHANLSATQIYTHTTYEKLNKNYKKAHPRGDNTNN